MWCRVVVCGDGGSRFNLISLLVVTVGGDVAEAMGDLKLGLGVGPISALGIQASFFEYLFSCYDFLFLIVVGFCLNESPIYKRFFYTSSLFFN